MRKAALDNCLPLQDLINQDDGGELGRDASGNPILRDIGSWLKTRMKLAFKVSQACSS